MIISYGCFLLIDKHLVSKLAATTNKARIRCYNSLSFFLLPFQGFFLLPSTLTTLKGVYVKYTNRCIVLPCYVFNLRAAILKERTKQ